MSFDMNYSLAAQQNNRKLAVCDTNINIINVACFKSSASYSRLYTKARAVVRITVVSKEYKQYCTGWLVGCEGHVMTNAHCFHDSNEETIANTEFDFLAEGEECDTNCAEKGACSTTRAVRNAVMVAKNSELDYALLKLPDGEQLASIYGYFSLQSTKALVGQSIYVPQHPQGHGKSISFQDESGKIFQILSNFTKPDDVRVAPENRRCDQGNVVSYKADTYKGSSGAPVVDISSNLVAALHFCGQCSGNSGVNAGIPMHSIVQDLQSKALLPKCALDPEKIAANQRQSSASSSRISQSSMWYLFAPLLWQLYVAYSD